MNRKTFPVLCMLALLAAFPYFAAAQGCSDAGFCTLGEFKPGEPASAEEMPRNHLKLGVSSGRADYDINVYAGYLEYGRQFSNRFGMSVKLTSLAQQSRNAGVIRNDVSTFGLSDVFLTADYAASTKLRLTLGAKIPLNAADRSRDGLPLPMDYQSSLGTFDLIAGLGYTIGKLDLVLALQQPLSQNENAFVASDYPPTSIFRTFQTTQDFKRAGDVLLRVSYAFPLGSKWRLTPSLLPIYHLAEDRYTYALGADRAIDGSSGLTLNATAYLDYRINPGNALQLNFGLPLVVREARPDGLTRSYVATLEYLLNF